MMKRSSRQFGQDLVAKVKNLVALAPVLGAISRPEFSEKSFWLFGRTLRVDSLKGLIIFSGKISAQPHT